MTNTTHPYYMPALHRHVATRGTRFTDVTASTPLCCPARATLMTGMYAHCTNITANNNPAGG